MTEKMTEKTYTQAEVDAIVERALRARETDLFQEALLRGPTLHDVPAMEGQRVVIVGEARYDVLLAQSQRPDEDGLAALMNSDEV